MENYLLELLAAEQIFKLLLCYCIQTYSMCITVTKIQVSSIYSLVL